LIFGLTCGAGALLLPHGAAKGTPLHLYKPLTGRMDFRLQTSFCPEVGCRTKEVGNRLASVLGQDASVLGIEYVYSAMLNTGVVASLRKDVPARVLLDNPNWAKRLWQLFTEALNPQVDLTIHAAVHVHWSRVLPTDDEVRSYIGRPPRKHTRDILVKPKLGGKPLQGTIGFIVQIRAGRDTQIHPQMNQQTVAQLVPALFPNLAKQFSS
jgi:hypothetical protein